MSPRTESEFGTLLAKNIRKKGYTQRWVAHKLHLDESVISEYVTSAAVPPLDRLDTLLKWLGLSHKDREELKKAREDYLEKYGGVRAHQVQPTPRGPKITLKLIYDQDLKNMKKKTARPILLDLDLEGNTVIEVPYWRNGEVEIS